MSIFDPITILTQIYQSEINNWWIYPNPNRMLVEAILIQQTTSKNVMKASAQLQALGIFKAPYNQTWWRIRQLNTSELEQAIYSSGFYRIKAKRIQNFADWIIKYDCDFNQIKKLPLSQLRQELNAINGIGPETADVMILYAFEQPVFIPDTYCLRLYQQLKILPSKITYRTAQNFFEGQPDMTSDYLLAQHWHAAIDEYGKHPQKFLNSKYKKIIPEK